MARDEDQIDSQTTERLGALHALVSTEVPQLIDLVVRATKSQWGRLHLIGDDGEDHVAARFGAAPPGVAGETIVVSIQVDGRALGAIHLGRLEPAYTQDEGRWARQLAAHVGMRIENARLHSEGDKRLQHVSLLLELARLGAASHDLSSVLARALDSMKEAFAAEFLSVHLITGDGRCLALDGHRKPAGPPWQRLVERIARVDVDAQTLVGRVARERKTVELGAAKWPEPMRAVAEELSVEFGAATPLLAGERLVGVLTVIRTHAQAFSRDDIRMLESCATQFAAVVEHARVFEEEQRRARDLSLINEVGSQMTQHLDLAAILAIGVRQMTRVSEVSRTELLLVEPQHGVLRMVAASPETLPPGAQEGMPNVVLPLAGTSLAHHALAGAKPVWTDDATNDPRAANELAKRMGYHAILAVPLITDGKPVGVLALCDVRRGRRFSAPEIETAVAIGNQLAAAIANARLFDDLRTSYEQLARTQQQLIGQERLAALGELSAVMAHEVRNPLAIIFNAIASLKKLDHGPGDAQTLLDIVAEEAGQLNRIVGDLLDFARPHEPVFRLESLEDLVWGALEAAKAAEQPDRIDFVVALGKAMPLVSLDARLLKQALINLITNAIQALPNGGRVEIHTAPDGESAVQVSVVDNGPGIAHELGGRVLQPFFTTKPTGTGLGLAIVKRIAETHDGELVLTPTPGGGTTTILRLPLRPRASTRPIPAE